MPPPFKFTYYLYTSNETSPFLWSYGIINCYTILSVYYVYGFFTWLSFYFYLLIVAYLTNFNSFTIAYSYFDGFSSFPYCFFCYNFIIYWNYSQSLTCLYEPLAIILPFFIMTILSDLSKYFIACVGIITVLSLRYFNIVSSIKNLPTWTSTALNISSNKYMSLFEYRALAKPILAFWPPDKLTPF